MESYLRSERSVHFAIIVCFVLQDVCPQNEISDYILTTSLVLGRGTSRPRDYLDHMYTSEHGQTMSRPMIAI